MSCGDDLVRVGWGAGLIMEAELPALPEPLSYVVDSDPAKWHKSIAGVPIRPPQSLLEEDPARLRVHLFASRWPGICEALQQMGFDEKFIARQVIKPATARYPEFAKNCTTLKQETLRSVAVSSLPINLNFDITNICNLRCPLCPTGQGDPRYPRGRMRFEHFRKVMDEVGRCASDIYLFNWGEAFLHPDLFRMIRYAKARFGCRVTISSNFNTVTEAQLEQLVESGLDFLSLSIDGSSQATYARYRVGGDYQRVIDNIRRLQAIKAARGRKIPAVEWRYLVNAYNDAPAEIDRARNLAEKLGLIFNLGAIHVDMGKEIEEGTAAQLAVNGHWISPRHSDYDLEKGERAVKKTDCRIPWEIAYINWNGDLAPCCGLYDPGYAFGNVFEQPFREVWNGPAIQAARDVLIDNKITGHICSRCRQGGYIV